MSTYWGYFCKDCKKETDHWRNHGEEILSILYKKEKVINDFLKEVSGLAELHLYGFDINNDEPLEWLKKHRGHNVILKNEYGEEKKIVDK